MAVTAGTRIGRYEILSFLGAGGMGEVYLAQDTRLKRSVALKLLPAEFITNEDILRRFEHEACAASALNHPNILTVYEIGEFDGTRFIVTEYVDGETLRQRMTHSRLTLSEILDVGIQVAGALSEAHATGIVHRDVKPENIMLRADGILKVLDFGVAKLSETLVKRERVDREAATIISEQTEPGQVIGTVAYMSPEQARGLKIDTRTDCFSVGAVLYEMITGHRPFDGATTSDVLVSVLEKEPPKLSLEAPGTPPEIERIVNKALDKDRDMRYQSIADLRVDLARLQRDLNSGRVSAIHTTVPDAAHEQPAVEDDVIHRTLSDTDPRVLQTTRFSRIAAVLAALAGLTFIAGWIAYNGSVWSELKLNVPKAAISSKAREVVLGLGYDPTGLNERTQFTKTDFDLKHVATKFGLDGVRRAMREGKAAEWRTVLRQQDWIFFSPEMLPPLKPKPDKFTIAIDPNGRLVSFDALPDQKAEGAPLEEKQAIEFARDTARQWLNVDPSGYELEFIRRSNPPASVEITWHNPNLFFDHREDIQANLQGPRLIKLSRSFEPQHVSGGAKKSRLSTVIGDARTVLAVLTLIAIYVFGVFYLIKGRKWYALGRRLPIVAASMLTAAVFIVLVSEMGFLFAILTATVMGIAYFPFVAGLFEWLRRIGPVRLYGAEQFVRGRFLSGPVASAIVHGVFGGAFLVGTGNLLGAVRERLSGYYPTLRESFPDVSSGFPLAEVPSNFAIAISLVLCVAFLVELVERMVGKQILVTPICALIITPMFLDFMEQTIFLVAVDCAFWLVRAAVIVWTYRARGFAAAWLLVSSLMLLYDALATRSWGDPAFVFQSNVMLVIVAAMLALGAWGYLGARVKKNLVAIDVK